MKIPYIGELSKQQLLVAIVIIIFVGEMLYGFFINLVQQAHGENRPTIKEEQEYAIMRGKVVGLEYIETKDNKTAELLEKLGINLMKLGDTYATEGEINYSPLNNLSNVDATFKERILIDLVTTSSGVFNTTYQVELTLHKYIPVGTVLEMKGKALLFNNSISALYPESMFVRNIPINGSYPIKRVVSRSYVYFIPFGERNAWRGKPNASISDVVYTNASFKPSFAAYAGEGYIVVYENFTNLSLLKKVLPDAVPQPSYILSEEPLNLSYNSTFREVAVVDLDGLEIPLNVTIPLDVNDTVHVEGAIERSGTYLVGYNLTAHPISQQDHLNSTVS